MTEAPEIHEDTKQQDGELNVEKKEEKDTPKINGSSTTSNGDATHEKRSRPHSDPDAQQMVIASLRSQVQDLFSQVSELNNKLVKSYDRVSDLEDDLHVASATNRSSSIKISQLEMERTQHLSALNTGLLVEKSHVTAELNRLMEKATEEAAQRGQAESARRDIEKDLDDLSATLFGQANSMVAEARFAQHLSEQKVDVAERALKGAEEAVGVMQQQMQALQAEKEEAEQKAEASAVAMGMTIGKGISRRASGNPTISLRLLSSHSPYQEFMLFVAHLRSIHPSSPQPPAITTLLPLPFLARLLTEDSEPTTRLDIAPSLNWLSRRSVLSAIHSGQLIIEPISSTILLQETSVPGLNSSNSNISCALCGTPIFSSPVAGSIHSHPLPPVLTQTSSGSTSWSASLFKKPSASYSVSTNNSVPSTPNLGSIQGLSPSQVYIFRLSTPSSGTSSIPLPSLPKASISGISSSPSPQQTHIDNTSYTSSPNSQSSTVYPLCTNNWCLSRLRTTCSLWAFVRTGIVEKIWEEEVPTLPVVTISPTSEKPPVPPRRRGIWGMASALGERATNWGEGDKDKSKKAAAAIPASPTPPPVEPKHIERRRLPPPLPASTEGSPVVPIKHAVPPPLPKRSEVRQASPPTEPSAATETAPPIDPAAGTVPKEPKLPPRPPRRPMTPASVPLPESRPHTPPIVSSTPAAPGTPTPPPLPRRAAARVPRVPADISPPSSGPDEETKAEDAEKTEIGKEVSPVPSVEPISEAPVSTEEKLNEDKDKDKEEENIPETESAVVSPSVEEDVFIDAVSEPEAAAAISDPEEAKGTVEATDAEKDGLPDNVKEAKTEENVAEKTDEKVEEEKEESVEDSAEEKVEEKVEKAEGGAEEKAEDKVEEKAKTTEEKTGDGVSAVVNATETQPAEEKEVKTVEADAIDTDDSKNTLDDHVSGTYVGDTTWEERTWKEIVRLKEEMFWARIGGSKH